MGIAAERQAIRCTIKGRVQGVFYRAASADRANELGLDGWARNLPDGSVEIVVAGPADAVESLVAWLWTGPPRADVRSVGVEVWPGSVDSGFRVQR